MCVCVCVCATWLGQKVLPLLMTLAKIIFLRIFHLLMSKLASTIKKTVHIELWVAHILFLFVHQLLVLLSCWRGSYFCQACHWILLPLLLPLLFGSKKGISHPLRVPILCHLVLKCWPLVLQLPFFAYDSNYKTATSTTVEEKKNGWRTEWREREEELTRFNGPGRSTSTFADSAFSLFPPIDFRRRRRSSRRRLSTLRRRLAPSTSVRLFCVDVVVVAVASETFYLSKKRRF